MGGSLLPATAQSIISVGRAVNGRGPTTSAVSITVPGYGAGNPALVVTRATFPRNGGFSGVGSNQGRALGGGGTNGWSGGNRGWGNNGCSGGVTNGTFDTGCSNYNNINYLGLPPWYRLNYYTPTTEEIDNGTAYQNIPSSHAWRGYGVPDGYPGTTGYGMPASQANVQAGAQQNVDFVVAVQRELRRRGFYNGIVNGISDAATRSAIRSFEARAGLPVTGVIGVPLLRTFGFF